MVPGRWRQEFTLLKAAAGAKKRYMACRLIITLPIRPGGRDVEAVYEDVGELEAGSRAGLKALYSDARKRAGVAAGIGAYLYTALQPVVLPIAVGDRHVQLVRMSGRPDLLVISAATEEWLRDDYERQISTEPARRDLGEILAHGEPEGGTGQGEAAAESVERTPGQAFWDGEVPPPEPEPGEERADRGTSLRTPSGQADGNGVVVVDFRGPGHDDAA